MIFCVTSYLFRGKAMTALYQRSVYRCLGHFGQPEPTSLLLSVMIFLLMLCSPGYRQAWRLLMGWHCWQSRLVNEKKRVERWFFSKEMEEAQVFRAKAWFPMRVGVHGLVRGKFFVKSFPCGMFFGAVWGWGRQYTAFTALVNAAKRRSWPQGGPRGQIVGEFYKRMEWVAWTKGPWVLRTWRHLAGIGCSS